MTEGDFEKLREEMVRTQLELRDITDARVLETMRHMPRDLFVPDELRQLWIEKLADGSTRESRQGGVAFVPMVRPS